MFDAARNARENVHAAKETDYVNDDLPGQKYIALVPGMNQHFFVYVTKQLGEIIKQKKRIYKIIQLQCQTIIR